MTATDRPGLSSPINWNLPVCARPELSESLQRTLRVRMSDRLLCAEAILDGFWSFPFSRSDVVQAFCHVFSRSTIDRTLAQLEMHGVIACVEMSSESGRISAVYRAQPKSDWHSVDFDIAIARHNRYNATVARLGQKFAA